jgi:prepilin-type N-terminal cleavage/methylation domain-containing protein
MKKRGFTLIEMALTIVIIGITIGLLSPWLINAVQAYDLVSTRRIMLGQVRAGLDRMVREIRLIPGQAQIISTTASSFQFQYPAGTNITYSLSGTDLKRNTDKLIQNVTALTFTYYDQAGNTTTTASSVRSVGIQISAHTTSSNNAYTVRTRVFVRNTGNNYSSFTSP